MSPEGDARYLVDAQTWPLAVHLDGRRRSGARTDFPPGSLLVLYSDGITEASNALGEEYGPTRLRQAVTEAAAMPAEAAARHILHSATGFVGGEKPHDDQSILVLRRTSA